MPFFIKGKKGKYCVMWDETCINIKHNNTLSDNQCEWFALVEALMYIEAVYADKNVTIYTDSVLLLRQLKGKCADSCVPDIKSEDRYRIKSASLTPIYLKWNSYKNRLTGVVDITYRKCTKEENLARRELEK